MEYEIIEENNFDKARKKIKECKGKVIFTSDDDELNRKIVEKEEIEILLIKQAQRKDWAKQRNSGLNSVLSKIAKKKNVAIGILLDEVIEHTGKEKAEILARISQNIRLCIKSKLQMKYVIINEKNKRNLYDLKALGLVLGIPTWMMKSLEAE